MGRMGTISIVLNQIQDGLLKLVVHLYILNVQLQK